MKQLARWVSILAHPFVMVALLVAVPAMRQSSGNVVQSVLLVIIAVVVPIAVLMFLQVRRGRWSNVDASKPSERPILFMVALAGLVAALVWLLLNDPQSFLVRGMLTMAAFLSPRRSSHSLGQALSARRLRCPYSNDPFSARFRGRLHAHRRGPCGLLVAHRACTSPRSRARGRSGARCAHGNRACPNLTGPFRAKLETSVEADRAGTISHVGCLDPGDELVQVLGYGLDHGGRVPGGGAAADAAFVQ